MDPWSFDLAILELRKLFRNHVTREPRNLISGHNVDAVKIISSRNIRERYSPHRFQDQKFHALPQFKHGEPSLSATRLDRAHESRLYELKAWQISPRAHTLDGNRGSCNAWTGT